MSGQPESPGNRLQRRKARTRAALIDAAQGFIAAGKTSVPILEITQAADVGMGSFYNHFDSKEELFAAAVAEVLDAHGALLDEVTAHIADPAETFACSWRLTARLFRRHPREADIILANASALLSSDRGLAPRSLRDIKTAMAAGRFKIADPDLALAVAGGSLLGLGNLLRTQPGRDDAQAVDAVAEDILRLFGLSGREAAKISHRPLPEVDALLRPDPAA